MMLYELSGLDEWLEMQDGRLDEEEEASLMTIFCDVETYDDWFPDAQSK